MRWPTCGHWVWSVLRDPEFEYLDIWIVGVLGSTRLEFVYGAHFDAYEYYVIDYRYNG